MGGASRAVIHSHTQRRHLPTTKAPTKAFTSTEKCLYTQASHARRFARTNAGPQSSVDTLGGPQMGDGTRRCGDVWGAEGHSSLPPFSHRFLKQVKSRHEKQIVTQIFLSFLSFCETRTLSPFWNWGVLYT